MRKRLVSICIVAILAFIIYSYSGAAKDALVDETKNIEAESTKTESGEGTDEAEIKLIEGILEQEEQLTSSSVLQEESEPEKEMDFDGSNTHLSILQQYERAWEDETYTVGEWQNVAGVFMTLTNAKIQLGTKEKDCKLYYNMSDLTGEEAELMIGKEITIAEDLFACYDNFRRPNFEYVKRAMDDFWIERVDISFPDYRIEGKIGRNCMAYGTICCGMSCYRTDILKSAFFPVIGQTERGVFRNCIC